MASRRSSVPLVVRAFLVLVLSGVFLAPVRCLGSITDYDDGRSTMTVACDSVLGLTTPFSSRLWLLVPGAYVALAAARRQQAARTR